MKKTIRLISALVLAVCFVGMLVVPALAGSEFVDVKDGDYFANAVTWAVSNNVTKGRDTAHFAPNAMCTRAEVVTFLWRAFGEPESSASISFSDVKTTDYFYKAVCWAVENGITSGTSATKFSPSQTCTRGQVVTFLWRAKGQTEVTGDIDFEDVKADDYFYDAVRWAVAYEVTAGTSKTKFSPGSPCTRGQIVTFIDRANYYELDQLGSVSGQIVIVPVYMAYKTLENERVLYIEAALINNSDSDLQYVSEFMMAVSAVNGDDVVQLISDGTVFTSITLGDPMAPGEWDIITITVYDDSIAEQWANLYPVTVLNTHVEF